MRRVYISGAILLAVAAFAAPAGPSGPIRFEEIARRGGLKFTTETSPTENKNQPETMVGGVGVLDYDNDGFPDIFLVNGAAIPSLQKDDPKYKNRLQTRLWITSSLPTIREQGLLFVLSSSSSLNVAQTFVANRS